MYPHSPRNVYWEVTLACDLACRHCRADARPDRDPGELSAEEGRALLDDIATMGSLLILTGGDPLKRPDLFDLLAHARALRIPVAVTPSTTPTLEREVVHRLKALGAAMLGMSLDGPDAAVHDAFRGVPGTFARAMEALRWAREAALPVQVNTTVTAETLPHVARVHALLAGELSPPVKRWMLFLLVPVGRGAELGLPTAREVEELFSFLCDVSEGSPFQIGTVEAPHYRRYWIARRLAEGATPEEIRRNSRRQGFGMRDGNGVVFVSHTGDVYPAGFLPHRLGNVRDTPLSVLYRNSPELRVLRDMNRLHGPCGRCDYRWACGGSRARAFAMTGDALGSDPLCVLSVNDDGDPSRPAPPHSDRDGR